MQTLQLKQKATRLTNSQRIIKMLRWTELEYATFINETGLEYLERYIPNDRQGIHALNRSRIFWNWWKNQWAIRDTNYLEIVDLFSPNNWEPLYHQEHSPAVLTNSIFPSAVVLDESYAIMINDFQNQLR
jgi:hypothetical protein